MIKPGEYFLNSDAIEANAGLDVQKIEVANAGDRPVQVGSHFHFFEANRALKFDRATAYGRRLNVPSGTAVRFEPGQTHTVELIPFSGNRQVYGFNRLVEGSLDEQAPAAMQRLQEFEK